MKSVPNAENYISHVIITEGRDISRMLPEIPEDANKFTRGRLLLAAGSAGMAGAAVMAAKAALRSGVGYLDIALPEAIYPVVTAAVPEAVCTVYDPADPAGTEEKLRAAAEKADAVALGPGLGKNRERVCDILFACCRKKLVVDADGLNHLAGLSRGVFRETVPVLTPHEGEAARLLGTDSESIRKDREQALLEISEKYGAVVLLKGPGTLIGKADTPLYLNTTGNAGMARAGSGDVLTGIIGSLAAQGMKPLDAAAAGAWIHGRAGDLCRECFGIRSFTPGDMIEMLPKVFMEIESLK